jgi:hypothetical protein
VLVYSADEALIPVFPALLSGLDLMLPELARNLGSGWMPLEINHHGPSACDPQAYDRQ